MVASEERAETQRAGDRKKSINVHRAFVYGASAPGLGEFYAGSYIRGFITASIFISFSTWFILVFIDIIDSILGLFFNSLKGITPLALPDLPLHSLGISFVGIYYIWLWAMISSVDVAMEHHGKSNEPPQVGTLWGLVMSWFCPGSGQIYTGSRRFGYILFTGYLLGILLILPAYMHLFHSISLLAKSGQLSTDNPYALIVIIKGHMIKVNYSLGSLFQKIVRYFALSSTIVALKHGTLDTDAKWMKSSIVYGAALFGVGWLCPGSGQLLQGRDHAGWYFFAGYVSSLLLTGLLLGAGLITPKSADTLSWISVLIQWGAMIEAPFWMLRHE